MSSNTFRREFFKLVDFLLFLLLLSAAPLPWVVKLFLYHTDFGQVFYCNQGLFKMCSSTLYYTLNFYPILLDVEYLYKFYSHFWINLSDLSFDLSRCARGYMIKEKPQILHLVICGYLKFKSLGSPSVVQLWRETKLKQQKIKLSNRSSIWIPNWKI